VSHLNQKAERYLSDLGFIFTGSELYDSDLWVGAIVKKRNKSKSLAELIETGGYKYPGKAYRIRETGRIVHFNVKLLKREAFR